MNAPAAEIIWSWRPEMTPRLRRYVRATVAAAVLAIAVSTAIAVTTPTRFAIVVAFLIASVGVLWWIEHRRFTSTEVHVDAAGVLRVGDRRSSAEIDLADVDTVDVRLRTQPGISTFASPPRWTIEISGPTGAISHPIAHAAGLFNPERADVDRLRAELGALVDRSVTPGGADASREEVG